MKPKSYGYYILNNEGVAVAWEENSYDAARLANAKADIYYKTYYVYDIKKKTSKAYTGFNGNRNRIYHPYGRR